jgi:hypothetical protein
MVRRLLPLLFLVALYAHAGEKPGAAAEREQVSIAIYNDGVGLVREVRRLDLDKGTNEIVLGDVAAHMEPETATLRALSGPPLRLLEQRFDFDLLTPQKLLEKYVGRSVTVISTNPATGVETREDALVLAADGGTVLKFPDRIETGVPGRLAFKSIPPELRQRPTLTVRLDSPAAGRQTAELDYLADGLSWKADYVAALAPDGATLDLAGWATLTNRSGTSFDRARLQLVAGDVHRTHPLFAGRAAALEMAAPAPAMAPMAREEVGEYQVYSLDRAVTLADNQTQQVALLSAARVPVREEYVLTGEPWRYPSPLGGTGRQQKVAVFIAFKTAGGDLDKPLPKGVVRLYQRDTHGNVILLGEDAIDNTPKDSQVRLGIGNAFDVTATRTQLSYRKLPGNTTESAWRIELANAKARAVTVKVVEPMTGDWEITRESAHHEPGDAHAAVWQIAVPAGGRATLDYEVRTH